MQGKHCESDESETLMMKFVLLSHICRAPTFAINPTLHKNETRELTRPVYSPTLLQAEHERLPGTCYAEREDYFECLHSKKEYLQVAKVNDQVKINEQKAKEAEKAAKAGGAS